MIKKEDAIKIIKETGLVAIIRTDSAILAEKIAKACFNGGVKALEITFTVPDAEDAISKLVDEYKGSDVLIGAGSVMNFETAMKAVNAGAKFIVSPYSVRIVAKICNEMGILYIPGAMTLKETVHCMESGADIVKIFPAELFGPAIIKAFRAPMPHLQLMPTGGVDINNVGEWFEAGAVAVGIGNHLIYGAKTGNLNLVTETAKQFLDKIKVAREGKR